MRPRQLPGGGGAGGGQRLLWLQLAATVGLYNTACSRSWSVCQGQGLGDQQRQQQPQRCSSSSRAPSPRWHALPCLCAPPPFWPSALLSFSPPSPPPPSPHPQLLLPRACVAAHRGSLPSAQAGAPRGHRHCGGRGGARGRGAGAQVRGGLGGGVGEGGSCVWGGAAAVGSVEGAACFNFAPALTPVIAPPHPPAIRVPSPLPTHPLPTPTHPPIHPTPGHTGAST